LRGYLRETPLDMGEGKSGEGFSRIRIKGRVKNLLAHRGSEWVNFVITRLSGGHLQAGESGNPGPSRHSRETCPRMPLSGSRNPEDVDFLNPGFLPAGRRAR